MIRFLLNLLTLNIQWHLWRRTHTLQEFERRMITLGCTAVHTRNSIIFTTPKNGKIEINENEIIINPQRTA